MNFGTQKPSKIDKKMKKSRIFMQNLFKMSLCLKKKMNLNEISWKFEKHLHSVYFTPSPIKAL